MTEGDFRLPQWPHLIFGNGLYAEVYNGPTFFIGSDGMERVKFEFMPSDELETEYDIREEDRTNARTIVKDYPAEYLVTLCFTPSYTTHQLICDYNGSKNTPLMKHFKEELPLELQGLKKMLIACRAQIAALLEKNSKLQAEPEYADEIARKRFKKTLDDLRPGFAFKPPQEEEEFQNENLQ